MPTPCVLLERQSRSACRGRPTIWILGLSAFSGELGFRCNRIRAPASLPLTWCSRRSTETSFATQIHDDLLFRSESPGHREECVLLCGSHWAEYSARHRSARGRKRSYQHADEGIAVRGDHSPNADAADDFACCWNGDLCDGVFRARH